MSVAEMKIEVINKITSINSEVVLKEVLAILQNATEKEESSINLSKNYNTIKEQYGDVLQKLAK
ncbi:MAG: hypothetical protein JWR18_2596 [Segetibacter sp.]|jgi:flagellar biosynthesis/type III secretory pathway protein FliH|nr:hypothetical protein [Segetibacter sp.]